MDIKEKLKTFIDKQKAQKTAKNSVSASAYLAGAEGWSSSEFDEHLAVVGYQSRKGSISHEVPLSNEAQDVVIGTIEPIYFETDNPDVGSHELQKFPDIADIHVINGIRSRLRKQQAIVSRRVSDLIMAKQTDCMEEMAKIDKLQKEACLAVALCVEGRKSLAVGKDQFTSASLHIIANYRKRQRIVEVINNLKTIRTLQMTDIQLQKLLKAEDYPGAIQLLLECQTAAANFKQFSCISELSSKLQETLEAAEQQLDAALDRLLVNFNSNTYTKLHAAYSLLSKRQTLMDQLHLHLTSHIHNTAFTVVLGYVELYSSSAPANMYQSSNNLLNNNTTTNNNTSPTSANASSVQTSSFSKMQYSDICKYVDSECFLACYLDLCKSMWEMLRNYKAIIRWHQSEDAKCEALAENTVNNNSNETQSNSPMRTTASSSSEALDESSYVKQKLQHGLYRIWQDVQAKIRTFILASDLSHFQFDDFLRVLDVTNRLIEVGSEFCGSQSEGLRETVRRQSTCFFRREHAARLEELHMFLENEAWQVVPLKTTFTVYQLLEFRFLKTRSGGSDRSLASLSSPSKRQDRLWALDGSGSPFDQCLEETSVEEDILASSGNNKDHSVSDEDSEDEEDALDRDYVEEAEDAPGGGGGDTGGSLAARRTQAIAKLPVVTNTSLTILRLVGKYLRMMKLLQPIAYDVFTCLTQLVHYYLYTICHTFGVRNSSGGGLSSRLSGLLQRIEGDVVALEDSDHHSSSPGNDGSTPECATAKVPRARASPLVSSYAACSVEGAATRVVACESLARLLHELRGLRETALARLLPSAAHHRLGLFYTTMADALPEVVAGVYGCVGAGAVPQQQLVRQMAAVSWSINSLESQHNAYVDDTLAMMQRFSQLVSSVRSQQPVPRTAERSLWRAAVEALHTTLLLGFAEARTCSNEGRSLMLLDYQQLTSKLEPLSGLRPLPGRPLVEGFIKAFYLPEAALREWLQQHRAEYGTKTLSALLAVMGHIPRHARSSLVAALEAVGD